MNTNFRKVDIRMIEKLRQLKKKSHMTNQQIAEKSNIPESTVARIFSGKTPNPTIATVVAMAKAMGGSPTDLLSEEDEKAAKEHSANCSKCMNPGCNGKPATVISEEALPVPDNNSPADPELNVTELPAQESLPSKDSSREKIYEDMIGLYQNEIRKKDVWISRLFWCLAGIMLFILFVLIFDILHPNFGFVKY